MCDPERSKPTHALNPKRIAAGQTQTQIIEHMFWTLNWDRKKPTTIPQSRIAEYIQIVFHVKHPASQLAGKG